MMASAGPIQPSRRATDVATTIVLASEPPDPVLEPFEPIGVNDPDVAHGGRSRRMPGPPIPGGLVTRARTPMALPTRVRRLPPSLR